jgi:hypothetical protein
MAYCVKVTSRGVATGRLFLLVACCMAFGRAAPSHSATTQRTFLPVVAGASAPLQVVSSVLQVREVPKCSTCQEYTVIYGTLENISANTIYSATLKVYLYDANGSLLASPLLAPHLVATFPQGINSFDLVYSSPVTTYAIQVVSWNTTFRTEYLPVTVVSTRIGGDGYIYNNVSATLRNNQAFTLYNVRAVAVLDANTPAVFTLDELAPGETREVSTSYYYSVFFGERVVSSSAQGTHQP